MPFLHHSTGDPNIPNERSYEEVMGKNGLNAVLRTSALEQYVDNLPPDDLNPSVKSSDYTRLNEAIENFYGRGGRGMLRRIGKASFQYAVREQSALPGLAGVALKLLPQKQRVHFILNSLANALKKTNPQVQAETFFRQNYMATAATNSKVIEDGSDGNPGYQIAYDRITGDHWVFWEMYYQNAHV